MLTNSFRLLRNGDVRKPLGERKEQFWSIKRLNSNWGSLGKYGIVRAPR